MAMSTFLRRSGALVTGVGVTAALTLLSPPNAQAAVHGQYGAMGGAYAQYVGPTVGGLCNLTSAPGSDNVTSSIADFTHGTRKRSIKLNAQYTASDNPSDTTRVKGHIDSKMTIEKRHRDLKSFELTADGKLSISHSIAGSSCSASGRVVAATQVVFSEHHKGWFYLTHDTRKPNSVVTSVLVNAKNGKIVTLAFFEGTRSHATSRALIKPGKYVLLETQVGLAIGQNGIILAKGASTAKKVHHNLSVSGEFKRLKH